MTKAEKAAKKAAAEAAEKAAAEKAAVALSDTLHGVTPAAEPAPAPAAEPETAAPAEPAPIVDPVVCVICKRTVEKAHTLAIPRNGYSDYFCKGESAKSGCRAPAPSAAELAEKAAAAKTAAEARKAEKAQKSAAKKAAPAAAVITYTAPALEGETAAAFSKAARQLKIIVNLIAAAPDRTMTKKAVCETLDALNGRGDAATDLATRQTALAILMHYQKVMVDKGFLTQTAVVPAAPATEPAPADKPADSAPAPDAETAEKP